MSDVITDPAAAPAAPAAPAASSPPVEERRRATFLRRFLRQRGAVVALGFLAFVALVAIAAPVLAPHDPNGQNLRAVLQGPGSEYWLGSDELGRDILSRLLFGARTSLLAAVVAVGVGVVLGVPLGLLAGYVGRWLDGALSRIADGILSFPPLLLAIAIVGVLGTGLTNAMIAIGIVFAPRFFRVVRSSVLALRSETYVEAAHSIGSSHFRIIRRHIVPNALSPLLIQIMVATGLAMLSEAGLSFLGLGVQPPDPSWGSMLGSAYRHVSREPWQAVWPGLAIVLVVFSCNVVGDGLRASIGRQVRRDA